MEDYPQKTKEKCVPIQPQKGHVIWAGCAHRPDFWLKSADICVCLPPSLHPSPFPSFLLSLSPSFLPSPSSPPSSLHPLLLFSLLPPSLPSLPLSLQSTNISQAPTGPPRSVLGTRVIPRGRRQGPFSRRSHGPSGRQT